MAKEKSHTKTERFIQYAPIFGIVLVVSGLLLLLDQRIKTTWLSISIPLFISVILIGAGIYLKRLIWLLPGLIILGLGGFLFVMLQRLLVLGVNQRLAVGFGVNAVIWLLICLAIKLMRSKIDWWTLFVAAIFAGLSIIYSLGKLQLLDFVLFITVPIGFVFLAWGIVRRRVGFVIPGSLLGTIAMGVYMGWSASSKPDGLQETGVMLVWFALGWLLITVFSRIIEKKFIWWPLIPGGIFLMVGSGLYIGGNPGNALGFLGNTGSIALILFGIYLILLKYGMKNKD